MTQRDQLYKCAKCGNIVGVMHKAGGTLVCCGQPMDLITENTEDAAVEKHVPVIEKVQGGYKVTVGEVNHPMVDAHYIEWIQLIAGDKVYTEYLSPGQTPEATFLIEAESVTAKAYCNLHGNWKKEA